MATVNIYMYFQHKFYEALDEDVDEDQEEDDESDVKLFKVSDADGSLDMDLVKEYKVTADDLDGNVRTVFFSFVQSL